MPSLADTRRTNLLASAGLTVDTGRALSESDLERRVQIVNAGLTVDTAVRFTEADLRRITGISQNPNVVTYGGVAPSNLFDTAIYDTAVYG